MDGLLALLGLDISLVQHKNIGCEASSNLSMNVVGSHNS